MRSRCFLLAVLMLASVPPLVGAGRAQALAATVVPSLPSCADCARDIAVTSAGATYSGYRLDAQGTVRAFGSAPPVVGPSFGFDIARRIVLRPNGGGYVLDGWGGVHAVGGAPALTFSGYWSGWDIARDLVLLPSGSGGYVLDGLGGVHPFGNAPTQLTLSAYFTWDIARALALTASTSLGAQGYVLDGWGALHPFSTGPLPLPPAAGLHDYFPGYDEFRDVQLSANGSGYTLSDWGGVHGVGSVLAAENNDGYSANGVLRAGFVDVDGSGIALRPNGTLATLALAEAGEPPRHDISEEGNLGLAPPLSTLIVPLSEFGIDLPEVEDPTLDVGPTTASHGVETQPRVDRQLMIDKAREWTIPGQKFSSTSNPVYVRAKNDCTNFVSRLLYAGGWQMHADNGIGITRVHKRTGSWFVNNFQRPWRRGKFSFTWAASENFGLMLHDTKWAKPVTRWENLQPGDIITADWHDAKDPEDADHTMIVTRRSLPYANANQGIYVTYHTSDREDVDLAWVAAQQQGETGNPPTFYGWRAPAIPEKVL